MCAPSGPRKAFGPATLDDSEFPEPITPLSGHAYAEPWAWHPIFTWAKSLRCIAALLFCFAVAGTLHAQAEETTFALDKVVLKLGAGDGQASMTGRIIDYTGTELRFQESETSAIRTYPSSQVVRFETAQTAEHDRGIRAAAEDRIPEAVAELSKALEAEPRGWVKREILAMLVRLALRQGDMMSAVTRFESLLESDPKTMYYPLIPLVWTLDTPPSRLVDAARNWIRHKQEPIQLIGASVLLSTRQTAEEARLELRRLMASVDTRVYGLAEAQLWRTRLTARDLDPPEVDRWIPRLEKMPIELRGGPYFVIGQAYFRLEQYEQAAMNLLWVPMVYPDDYQLESRACFDAADALSRIGQMNEAMTLFRELTQRFGASPYAADALKRLKELAEEETKQPQPPAVEAK